MLLKDAIEQVESMDDFFDDVLIEQGEGYQVIGYGPKIRVPSLDLTIMEMDFLCFDEEMQDYMADWSGTAFFLNGEYVYSEQDGIAVAYHNFCHIFFEKDADFDVQAEIIDEEL